MKRWALMIAVLYTVLLLVLIVPGAWLAFGPQSGLGEAIGMLLFWPYWIWLALMLVSQFALLAVPVRVATRRPVARGPLWCSVLAGGLMAGALLAGAFLCLYELVMRDKGNGNGCAREAIALAMLTWGAWTLIFFRISRHVKPADVVSRQCRRLFQGSVLELLIAVPTHIVARARDYCCAGFLTFIGLTMGVSVMLFAFGPSVFLLFVERWKRLHPSRDHAPGLPPG